MVSCATAWLSLVIAAAGETVLLDFFGESCPPCRRMEPIVEQLAARGYRVRKVNCNREPQLASRFGVTQIPCFVMLVDGREVDRVVGMTSLARLEQMCRLGAARAGEARPSPVDAAALGAPPPAAGQPAVIPAVQTGPDPAALCSAGAKGPAADVNDFVSATARLRIEDSSGHSYGSGTIIDARQGEALILTCGHIFRESKGRGRIEVDLFGPTPAQRIPGHVLHYDLQNDLGLLVIRTPGPVSVARVAPAGYRVARGDKVISVGCNNGGEPSVRQSYVTSVDKFLGAPNVQVAGMPVQGRSGGGLFSSEGYLIGVCNFADPTDGEGIYAAPAAIHAELDCVNLSAIYRSPSRQLAVSGTAVASEGPPPMARQMPRPDQNNTATSLADQTRAPGPSPPDLRHAPAESAQSLSEAERVALEELLRRRAEGAEVICVIRPRSDPAARSEILVLDRVSPAFLRQLAAGTLAQLDRQLTSLDVPRTTQGAGDGAQAVPPSGRPRTILEYTAPPAGGASPVGPPH